MKMTSEFGRDLIDDWLKKLPAGVGDGVERELRAWLKAHKHLRPDFWGRPQFAWLKGQKGIGEVIFSYRNVEYRPLGCFGPGNDQFTILVGATKSRKRRGLTNWDPSDAPNIAKKLLSEMANGRSLYEFEIY